MIGLFVKIPFHSQLKKADPALVSELSTTVSAVAGVFKARLQPMDESFFLAFDEGEGCARLRAAEAARGLEAKLHALSPRLHGWDLLLSEGPGAEEVQKEAARLWVGVGGDGLFISPPASALFEGYLGLEVGSAIPRVLTFPYASPPLPEAYRPPAPAQFTLERFIDEVGRHGIGEAEADLLLAVGPGSAPCDYLEASLQALYKDASGTFLRIHASTGENSPFGPILSSLHEEGLGPDLGILPAPDRVKLEELAPVAAFLASSPFRRAYSPAIKTRFRLYFSLRLKLYARTRKLAGLPPVIILDGLDRFSPDSLELLGEVLAEALESEGLVLFGTAAAPSGGLGELRIRMVSAPPPSPVAIAQTALAACRDGENSGIEAGQGPALAAAAEGDGFRLGLALRLACLGRLPQARMDTTELAAAALATLPGEFAELLLALSLSEGVMDPACLEDFLCVAGFVEGIRPLLIDCLRSLGFLAKQGPDRLLRAEAAAAAALVAPEGGARVRSAFQGKLIALHGGHRIGSSAALFWKVKESLPTPGAASLFYLDCLSADALYGISQEEGSRSTLPPLEGLSSFLAAYAAGDPEATAAALEVLDEGASRPGADPLEASLSSLSKAFDDYARGQGSQAATRAKPALMGLHSLGARRAEARAHRLLGLTSLAQSQVQDGADYLSNAYELAEELPDPLECILSAYAEAGALLVLGDLRRAASKGQSAARWAKASFRADWETACDFLAGRISFELGRYAQAEEDFGRVRASARVYDEPLAGARAEIWSGRAAAYSGATGKAYDLLGRHGEDPEAAWFLAELYHFQGRKEDAASEAAGALALLPSPGYSPADRTAWTSGFECLEGRCLGYGKERSYLADQIGAFAAFASGLVEGKPETVLAIAARTREERLATLHPQAHLYHLYCYLNLVAAGGGPLDPGTVLSKAFKALQTRTARMDEAGLKDDYLEKNRWNREILTEARKHKLI